MSSKAEPKDETPTAQQAAHKAEGKAEGKTDGPSSSSSAKDSKAGGGGGGAAGKDDDDEDEVEVVQFKVILIGDGAVGKTSIAMRFSQDAFAQTYKQTVGVDFFIRRLSFPKKEVVLQIWDIGGQSISSKMVGSYIGGAHAVLLCYDITNYESFANLEDWYRLVQKQFPRDGDKPQPLVGLVGNKNDMRHLTVVRSEQHNKFKDENGFESFMISAKTGDNIKQTFNRIAASLAGITLTKAELEMSSFVVQAVVIDHTRHDPAVHGGAVPDYNKKRNCVVS